MLKDNIKSRRTELGLTLEDVAKHIGVSRQTVQKYESGIVLNIPSDKIEKISEILKTTPTKLMGWEIEKPATNDDGLDKETAKFMEMVDKLSPQDKARVEGYIESLLQNQ